MLSSSSVITLRGYTSIITKQLMNKQVEESMGLENKSNFLMNRKKWVYNLLICPSLLLFEKKLHRTFLFTSLACIQWFFFIILFYKSNQWFICWIKCYLFSFRIFSCLFQFDVLKYFLGGQATWGCFLAIFNFFTVNSQIWQ